MVAPSPKITLDFPADMEPVYSNLFRISHTLTEFILDFARILPGSPSPKVQTRTVVSPAGAKLLYRALGENLAHFEATYGEIVLPGDSNLANDLFRTIHPPENPPST